MKKRKINVTQEFFCCLSLPVGMTVFNFSLNVREYFKYKIFLLIFEKLDFYG
jgi:hypothetical protein